jgi:hypothetical protein
VTLLRTEKKASGRKTLAINRGAIVDQSPRKGEKEEPMSERPEMFVATDQQMGSAPPFRSFGWFCLLSS